MSERETVLYGETRAATTEDDLDYIATALDAYTVVYDDGTVRIERDGDAPAPSTAAGEDNEGDLDRMVVRRRLADQSVDVLESKAERLGIENPMRLSKASLIGAILDARDDVADQA
ncbi:hypothetical protein Z052_01830 [Halorubrum sp. C191]|uniref:hypothetical protein n=1 Tax=Halorubrum sp. C191 TaxID=1383842 RepID=UPI000C07079B|nr:hypothetical protein [Halorubrum sp. C191]PHQ43902.1 hypothetical protein Z052_01830 [Halorubrum sp. C191]